MASNSRHNNGCYELCSLGESIASKYFQCPMTAHKAVFDGVDHYRHIAYEYKTMKANGDIKVHIESKSYIRKLEYALRHRLTVKVILILIHDNYVELYQSQLKQHLRLCNMEYIATIKI